MAAGGNESLQAVADAQHGGCAVAVAGLHDNGADDVVDAGAESSAGDDGAFDLARIVVQPFPRPRSFQEHGGTIRSIFAAVFLIQKKRTRNVAHVRAGNGRRHTGLAHAIYAAELHGIKIGTG